MYTETYRFSIKIKPDKASATEDVEVEIDESWSEHQEAVALIEAYESWLDKVLEYEFKKVK